MVKTISRVVVFYFILVGAIAIIGGVQQETGILPEVGLPQAAPAFATWVSWLIFRKDKIRLTFVSKGTPNQRYLAAVLIPMGISVVVFVMALCFIRDLGLQSLGASLPLALWIWTPFGSLGEEIGWRGYLNKYLDTRIGGLASAVLTGVLWTFFHVQYLGNGIVFVFFLLVLIISYAVVIYAVTADQEFSILLATIFHIMINLGTFVMVNVINDLPFMMLNSLVWAAAAAYIYFTRQMGFAKS